MRELEPEFEPFDIAHVSVAGWDPGNAAGFEIARLGKHAEIQK